MRTSHLDQFKRSNIEAIRLIVYNVGQRTTSWLSTKLLLPLEDLKAGMARFLKIVGTFRQQILFDDEPRCQVEGFGWAPALSEQA